MNKFLNKNLIVPAVGLLLPVLTMAVSDDGVSVEVKEVKMSEVLGRVAQYFLGAVVIASVFMILWAAFSFVTASGDDTKLANARKSITFAIIGLVIALLAQVIVNFAITAVGTNVNVNLNNNN